MRRILFVASVAVASSFAISQTASAAESLDSCGDFFFEPVGDVECTVEVEGGCEAACKPIAFEVECAAELQVGCQGGCEVEIDVDCNADCNLGCDVECEGGEFDCGASCNATCEADCDSRCSDGECSASCRANCSASCEAHCNVELPSCEAECEASCSGSCEASASADCQIECQADGYVDCEADLQGGCEVACEEPSGQIFCDGQWVNTDDFEGCIADIQSYFDIEVSGYLDCESDSNSASCEVGGEISTGGCSAAPGGADAHIGFLMLGLVGAGAAVARRRNKKA